MSLGASAAAPGSMALGLARSRCWVRGGYRVGCGVWGGVLGAGYVVCVGYRVRCRVWGGDWGLGVRWVLGAGWVWGAGCEGRGGKKPGALAGQHHAPREAPVARGSSRPAPAHRSVSGIRPCAPPSGILVLYRG